MKTWWMKLLGRFADRGKDLRIKALEDQLAAHRERIQAHKMELARERQNHANLYQVHEELQLRYVALQNQRFADWTGGAAAPEEVRS